MESPFPKTKPDSRAHRTVVIRILLLLEVCATIEVNASFASLRPDIRAEIDGFTHRWV
jgi:hypothetical protein